MTDRGKKIFLGVCIMLPFVLYCVYYYSIMIKNAPYRFSDFQSITFNYGLEDSLENRFNSATGEFRFVNERDSVIDTKVRLKKDDLLYLHRKAADLGFWNFPEDMSGEETDGTKKVPKYYIEFAYKEKTKRVNYETSYSGDPKLTDAVRSLITEIGNTINDARDRQAK